MEKYRPSLEGFAAGGKGPAPSDPVDPYLGLTLKGRYELERELGRGGVGVVYLAHDQQLLARSVVVKVLLDAAFQSGWARQKFKQEVEALARIDHPGVVGVLDLGEMPDGRPFFVMQFVEGITLRSLLGQRLPTLGQVAYLIRQVGQALTVAHERGIFHRDLKPENIMVQTLGHGDIQIKIIDFGLAKVENSLTDSGSIIGVLSGTLLYMAPEQLMAEPGTIASDVYSLGLIAFELLTGHLPFQAQTLYQLLELQRGGMIQSPRTLRPELPEEAERVLRQALAFEPRHRPAMARDFGETLARALVGTSGIEWENGLMQAGGEGSHPGAMQTLAMTSPAPSLESLSGLRDAPHHRSIEPVGGAVPLDSRLYIVRPTDEAFQAAIARRDSIVLVKGARQMGKTSLLARGLQQARQSGARVILTDFQKLNNIHLESAEALYMTLAQAIADQLDLDILVEDIWNARRGPNMAFERFLKREILAKVSQPVVWGLDEVDRLFTCSFGSEVFGLFRSWHNERSLDPTGPLQRLTLAIAYATEAHLFISDINQSPFNVGTRLELSDFDVDQVSTLNARHGSPLHGPPLKTPGELARFMALLGGHPYLIRRGLLECINRGMDITQLETEAARDEGMFGDHLRRILVLLAQDPPLCDAVKRVLQGKPCPSAESFYRLRSAGVIVGDSAQTAVPRCRLYAAYLRRHLLE